MREAPSTSKDTTLIPRALGFDWLSKHFDFHALGLSPQMFALKTCLMVLASHQAHNEKRQVELSEAKVVLPLWLLGRQTFSAAPNFGAAQVFLLADREAVEVADDLASEGLLHVVKVGCVFF